MEHPSSVPFVQSIMLDICTLSVVDGIEDSTRKPLHLTLRMARRGSTGRLRLETPLPPWGKTERLRPPPPMLNSTQFPLSDGYDW